MAELSPSGLGRLAACSISDELIILEVVGRRPGGPSWGSQLIRRVLASGLVALGVLCALLAGLFGFVNSHFHSPETFVDNNAALADNADVRERLFDGFRAEIVAIAEGRELGEQVEEADDAATSESDNADESDESDEADESIDDADPITDATIARDQAIEAVLFDTFDSELYADVFTDGLVSVQSQLIRSADIEEADRLRDNGDVTFDARRLYRPIYEQLAADPATAEITQNEVPPQYGIYKIADRETTVDPAWWMIQNGPNWRSLTFALAIVSFLGAVAVAERRPTRAIQYGAGLIGLALVVIVLVYILRAVVPLFADGRGSDGAVVATYASNVAPLVSAMIRLVVIGVVLAVVGWVAKLIWPDDWVYGQVSDDRGVRSVRSRRGARRAEPQQQQPVPRAAAAAQPAPYNPYAPPYGGGYPPGWGPAPYPGQPYAQPTYGAPYQQYPAGPYAQPAQPAAPVVNTGRPTVPVMPIPATTGETPVADAAPPISGDLPADAAQIVPKVVASATSPVLEPVAEAAPAGATPPEVEEVADGEPESQPIDGSVTRDQWATDADW